MDEIFYEGDGDEDSSGEIFLVRSHLPVCDEEVEVVGTTRGFGPFKGSHALSPAPAILSHSSLYLPKDCSASRTGTL